MKVEWAKSRARASRYMEEIKIVKEEMNRTIRFLRWKANEWRDRGRAKQKAGLVDDAYSDGLRAYAARQAAICDGQANSFLRKWSGVDGMVLAAQRECDEPSLFYERRKRELASSEEAEVPVLAVPGNNQSGDKSID